MADYTAYEDLSSVFPGGIDEKVVYSDISASTAAAALTYASYIENGEYEAATNLLANNSELAACMVTANKLNHISDMNIAIQRFILTQWVSQIEKSFSEIAGTKIYYSSTPPSNPQEGEIWLKPATTNV